MSTPRELKLATVCTYPECGCKVPQYAMSAHNRVNFCQKLKKLEDEEWAKKSIFPSKK